jgi:hypothetical protein
MWVQTPKTLPPPPPTVTATATSEVSMAAMLILKCAEVRSLLVA